MTMSGVTYSPPVPGTYTVELLGLARTDPTAFSSEAFRSLSNFVCCASLRSCNGTPVD
jgi:hypothetical protein